MHNITVLVKGKPRCTLQMHPSDADARGISAGQAVRVRSRVGEVLAPVEITDDVRPWCGVAAARVGALGRRHAVVGRR